MYAKFSKIACILSVATMFNRVIFTGKLDSLFIIASAVLLGIALAKNEVTVEWKKIRTLSIALGIILLSILFGSVVSFFKYHSVPVREILVEWRIFFGCILIFIEIIILGAKDTQFLIRISFAFLTSLIAVFLIYLPIPYLQNILGTDAERFTGLIGDANYYPTFMIFPFILLFYLLIREKFSRKNALRLSLFYIMMTLVIGSIFWSGSRGGLIGLLGGSGTFIIIASLHCQKKVKRALLLSLLFASTFVSGFFLLPTHAKSDVAHRVETISPTRVIQNGVTHTVTGIKIIDAIGKDQDRIGLWRQGLKAALGNPLGYGFAYKENINIKENSDHFAAHSLPLEISLTGGILLCISLGYILIKHLGLFLKQIAAHEKIDLESVMFSSLIGFLLCSIFLDTLLLRWFWVELAMLIAWQINRLNETLVS